MRSMSSASIPRKRSRTASTTSRGSSAIPEPQQILGRPPLTAPLPAREDAAAHTVDNLCTRPGRMQMTSRRLLLFTAVVAGTILAALVGAGVGGARSSASDTLVVVSPVAPPSLDREQFGTGTQQEVITNLMEPLIRYK